MGRAEIRRQQKAEGKKISVETVSQKSKIGVETLIKWREQEHEELSKQIASEYRRRLERAEDLIMSAMVFAAMNAVRDTWKLKLDLQKFFDNLMMERDIAFTGENSEGIRKSMKRAEEESGMEFHFDDINLEAELCQSDFDLSTEIQSMSPDRAYDYGWCNAILVGNIINTAVFADKMLDRGFDASEIQKLITEANNTARNMNDGNGKVTNFLINLRKRGIDLGDYNLKKLKEFRL